MESCQSLPKRSTWGRLGSVLYTCKRLRRIRHRFKHFWSISLSRPLRFSNTKHDLLRRGPCGGQRVGLQLVESSTTGPKRLPPPLSLPPRRASSSPPAVQKLVKGGRSRACPRKSGTGLEEYPPRARFLWLRRSRSVRLQKVGSKIRTHPP